jgi:hypothetical protein
MFANHLYFDQIWDRDSGKTKFRWEVDGKNMFDEQSNEKGSAAAGEEMRNSRLFSRAEAGVLIAHSVEAVLIIYKCSLEICLQP